MEKNLKEFTKEEIVKMAELQIELSNILGCPLVEGYEETLTTLKEGMKNDESARI